jgi:xanthine dehydrogenase accessory factor
MNDKSAQAVLKSIPQLLDAGTMTVLVTLLESREWVGAKLLVDEQGQSIGTLGNDSLDAFAREHASNFLKTRDDIRAVRGEDLASQTEFDKTLFLFERIQAEARLVICGAGHVGAALAMFAAISGYRVTLIDDRQEFLQPERFADDNVELMLGTDWTEAVQRAIGNGKGVAVAVVTRGHNEDEQCMRAAIKTDPDYLGLIGSKRRTSIVINRLKEAGATEEQVKRIHAPIGLDIGAVTPEEVALAILAEIICVRRGGTGLPMSTAKRRLET